MFRVAMTRGRETNVAYIYGRSVEYEDVAQANEGGYGRQRRRGKHLTRRLRNGVVNDDRPATANHIAAATAQDSLVPQVKDVQGRRAVSLRDRRNRHDAWRGAGNNCTAGTRAASDLAVTPDPPSEHGGEL